MLKLSTLLLLVAGLPMSPFDNILEVAEQLEEELSIGPLGINSYPKGLKEKSYSLLDPFWC